MLSLRIFVRTGIATAVAVLVTAAITGGLELTFGNLFLVYIFFLLVYHDLRADT